MLELEQSCERFRAVASLRLDGELTPLEAARHEEHAAWCEECRRYAAELAAITARIRATPAEALPAPVALELRAPLPARRAWLRPATRGAAAVAFLVLLVSGVDDSRERGLAQPSHEAAYFQSIDYERQLLHAVRRPEGVRGVSKAV